MFKKIKTRLYGIIISLITILIIIGFSCTMPISKNDNKASSSDKNEGIINNGVELTEEEEAALFSEINLKPESGEGSAVLTQGPNKASSVDEFESFLVGNFDLESKTADSNFNSSSRFWKTSKYFFGDLQDRVSNGYNPCSLRFQPDKLNSFMMDMKIEEEKSADSETWHPEEVVGLMKIVTDDGFIRNIDGKIIGEVHLGALKMDDKYDFGDIDFKRRYDHPVVFGNVISTLNSSPCHFRVHTLRNDYVRFQVEEWEYLNGYHPLELVSVIVLEKGTHIIGKNHDDEYYMVEAGTTDFYKGAPYTNGMVKNVSLMTDFVKKPYIFTASQNKGMDQTPFITRSQYINSTSDKFYIRLQHEEALNSKKRIEEEEIGYIAIGNVGKLYKKSTVDAYGWLQVKNGKLCDESGNPVQLRGMSSFWTNWEDGWKYANKYAVQELVSAWDIDVYRLAIGVDPHDGSNDPNKCGKRIPGNTGYAYNDLNKTIAEIRIAEIVEQCVKSGIYVIIDWHVHDALLTRDYDLVDGKNDGAISEDLIKQSIAFFTKMAVKYKNTPNVMFEIWNEPSMQKNNVLWAKAKPPGDWDNRIYNWNDHIRPYCETITSFIRAYGAKNIIIAPTECYDQRPQDTWGNALFRENEAYHNFLGYNILYSTHFYAGTTADWSTTVTGSPSTYDVHKPYGGIWQQMQFCIDNYKPDNYRKQVPFFVTEWGTSQFDGGQDPGKYVGINESDRWLSFLNENKISWCNWSISDKEEAASALMPGAGRYGFWSENAISKSGKYVRSKIREGRVIPRRD